MYSINIIENDKSLLGEFKKIAGLEVSQSERNDYHRLVCTEGCLINSNFITNDSKDLSLCVFDANKKIIAEYDGVCQQIEKTSETALIIYGHGLPFMSPGSVKIWESRYNEFPSTTETWRQLEEEELQAWLEVSLLDKRKPRTSMARQQKTTSINGNFIFNIDSFLCALGESIIGPSGYIGRCLNSFNECLKDPNYFDISLPDELVWEGYSVSLINFEKYQQHNYLPEIFNIIKNSGIEITLEN